MHVILQPGNATTPEVEEQRCSNESEEDSDEEEIDDSEGESDEEASTDEESENDQDGLAGRFKGVYATVKTAVNSAWSNACKV